MLVDTHMHIHMYVYYIHILTLYIPLIIVVSGSALGTETTELNKQTHTWAPLSHSFHPSTYKNIKIKF